MTITNEDLLAAIHEIDTKLEVHIAKDEAQWEKVTDVEEDLKVLAITTQADIKHLTAEGGKLRTKHAALAATIATVIGGGLQMILRAV